MRAFDFPGVRPVSKLDRTSAVRCRPVSGILRIVLNAAPALSLLLCAVTVALWVRSYSTFDYLTWARSTAGTDEPCVVDSTYVGSANGRLSVWQVRNLSYLPRDESVHYGRAPSVRLAAPSSAAVPHALVVGAAAVLPLLRVRRWRQRRALARVGRCRGCGYDLRATPDRCPECGREAKRA
jgi:hypothetical protein